MPYCDHRYTRLRSIQHTHIDICYKCHHLIRINKNTGESHEINCMQLDDIISIEIDNRTEDTAQDVKDAILSVVRK